MAQNLGFFTPWYLKKMFLTGSWKIIFWQYPSSLQYFITPLPLLRNCFILNSVWCAKPPYFCKTKYFFTYLQYNILYTYMCTPVCIYIHMVPVLFMYCIMCVIYVWICFFSLGLLHILLMQNKLSYGLCTVQNISRNKI